MFIFGIQNNSDKLYCGIENLVCPVYFSLYSFFFLIMLPALIFRKRYLVFGLTVLSNKVGVLVS